MTDTEAPEPVERGRYAVIETPDGGWAIPRATGLCERCQECGCGSQEDAVMVPGFVISIARQQMNGNSGGLKALVKAAMNRGT